MTSYYNDNNNNTSQDHFFASSNGFFKLKEAESTVNLKKRDIKFTDFPTNNINSTDRHKKFDDIKFKQGALTKFVSNLNQSCYIKNQYDANEMSMLTPDERDKTFLFKNKRNLTSLSNLMSHLNNNNNINNLYNNNNNVSKDNIDTINNNYTYVNDINIDDDVNNNKVLSSNNLPITQILDFETKGVLERVMYIQRAYKRRYLILNYTAEFIQSSYRAFKARKKVKKAFNDLSLFRNGLNRLSRVICPKYFTKFFMHLSNFKSKLFVVRYVIKIQKMFKTRLLIKKLKEEQIKRVVKEKAFIIKYKTYSKDIKKINSINDNKTHLIQKTYNNYLIRKYKAMLLAEKENRLKAEKIIKEEKEKPRVINKMKLNNKVDIKNNNEDIGCINNINKSNFNSKEADNKINGDNINMEEISNIIEVKESKYTFTNNNNKEENLIAKNNINNIEIKENIIIKENITDVLQENITERNALVPKIPDINDSLYKDSNWFKKDYFHNEFSIYKKNKYNNKNNKKLLNSIKKINTAYKKYSESKYRVVKISKEAYERLNMQNQKQTLVDKKNNEKENYNDIIDYNAETSKSLKIENKDNNIISNNNKAYKNNNDNLFDNYIKQNFIRRKIVINGKREICNSIILKTSDYSAQKKKDLLYKVNYMIVYIMSTLFPEKLIKKYKEKIELKSKSKLKLEKSSLKISENMKDNNNNTDNCEVSNIKIDGKNPEDTLTLNNYNNADSKEQQNSIITNKEDRIKKENSNKKDIIDEDLYNGNEYECDFDLQSQIIKNLIKKKVITNPEIKELSNNMEISSLDINHINPELVVKNIIENNILNDPNNLNISNKPENLDYLIKKINRNSINLKVVTKPFCLQKINILNKQKKQNVFVKKITSLLAKNAGYESINTYTNFNNKNYYIGNNEENTNTIKIKEIDFEDNQENKIINNNNDKNEDKNKDNSNIEYIHSKNKHTTNNKYIKKQVYIRNKKIHRDFSNSLFIKNIRSLKYDKDIILIQRQLFGIKEDIYSNKENPISNEMLKAKETNKLKNKNNNENDNDNVNSNIKNKEENPINSNNKVQNSTIKQRSINIKKLFKPVLIESNIKNYSNNISNNINNIQSILPNYNQSNKNSKTSRLRINSIPKHCLNKLIKLQRLIKVKINKNSTDKQELAKIRTKPRFNIMDLVEDEDKQGGFETNKDNSVLVRDNNDDKAQNSTGINKLYTTKSTKSLSFYNLSVFYKSTTDNSLINKIKSIQKHYNRDFAYKCYVLDNLPANRINEDKSKNNYDIKIEDKKNSANDVNEKLKQEDIENKENNDTTDANVKKDAQSIITKEKINEIKQVKKEFRFKPLLLNKADFAIKNLVVYNKKNYLTNNFAIKQAKRISKFISENRYTNAIQQVQQIKNKEKNISLIEERQQINKEEIEINETDNIERIDNDNDIIKPTEIEKVNNKINCDDYDNNNKSNNKVDKSLDQESNIVKSMSNNNNNIDNKALINDNEAIMIKKRFKISKNEIIDRLKIKTDFIKDNNNKNDLDDLIKQASFDGFVNTKINKPQKSNTKMNQSAIKITKLLKQFYLSTNSTNNKTNILKISEILKETKLLIKSKEKLDYTQAKQKDDLINEEEIINQENRDNETSTKEIIIDDNIKDIHNEEIIISKKFLIKNKEIQEAFKLNNTLNHKNLLYLLQSIRSNNNNNNSLITTNHTSFVKKQSSKLFLNKKILKIQTHFKKYINKKIKEEESRGIIKKTIIRKNDIVNAMKNSHLTKENIVDIPKDNKTDDKNNDIGNKEKELNLENKDMEKYFETIKTSNTNNIFTKNQDLEKRCRLDDAFNKDNKENHFTYHDNNYSEYYFNNLIIIKAIKLKRDFFNVKANKILSLFKKHSKYYKFKDIIIKREAINIKTIKKRDNDRLSKSFILWKKYNSLLNNSNKLKDLLIRLNINSINRILKQELISKLKQTKSKMTYLLEKSDKKNEIKDLKSKLVLWWKIIRLDKNTSVLIDKVEKAYNNSLKENLISKLQQISINTMKKEYLNKIIQISALNNNRIRLNKAVQRLLLFSDLKEFCNSEFLCSIKKDPQEDYLFSNSFNLNTVKAHLNNNSKYTQNHIFYKEVLLKKSIWENKKSNIKQSAFRTLTNCYYYKKLEQIIFKARYHIIIQKELFGKSFINKQNKNTEEQEQDNLIQLKNQLLLINKIKRLASAIAKPQFKFFMKSVFKVLVYNTGAQSNNSSNIQQLLFNLKLQKSEAHLEKFNIDDVDFFSMYSKRTEKSKRRADKIDSIYNSFANNTVSSPITEKHVLHFKENVKANKPNKVVRKTSQSVLSEKSYDGKSSNNQTVITENLKNKRNRVFSPFKDAEDSFPRISYQSFMLPAKIKKKNINEINKKFFDMFEASENEFFGDEPRFPKRSHIEKGVSKRKKKDSKFVIYRSKYNID